MTTYITVRCEYCLTEKTFVNEDPVDEGWFRLESMGDEGLIERTYCSGECLIADF